MTDQPDASITATRAEMDQYIAARVAEHEAELHAQFTRQLDTVRHKRDAERAEWERLRATEAAHQHTETQRLSNMIAELQHVPSMLQLSPVAYDFVSATMARNGRAAGPSPPATPSVPPAGVPPIPQAPAHDATLSSSIGPHRTNHGSSRSSAISRGRTATRQTRQTPRKKTRHPDVLSKDDDAPRTHYAAVTGAVAAYAIVPFPDEENQAEFTDRFTSTEAMDEAEKNGPRTVPRDLISVITQYNGLRRKGKIAARAAQISYDTLAKAIELCSKLGITIAAYDPREASDSHWNQAINHVVLGSFHQGLQNGSYKLLKANAQFADPSRASDLDKLYRHVVHQQGVRTLHNFRSPGVLVLQERMSAVYEDRKRLSERRTKTAEDNNHPPELVALARCRRAHSETRYNPEADQNERCSIEERSNEVTASDQNECCSIEERSNEVTAYFEYLDDLAVKASRWISARARPPVRVKVTPAPEPLTFKIETEAPLNFFDPVVYNRLPRAVRRRITSDPFSIAPLPHPEAFKMSMETF